MRIITSLLFIGMLFANCTAMGKVLSPVRPTTEKKRVSKEEMLRQDVVDYARNHIGKKYKYAGRSPKTGFDCSGFTHYVMSNFAIDLSPSSRQQEGQGEKVKIDEVQPGDLIFFRRSKSSSVFHVALVTRNDEKGIFVIHSTSRGVVEDNLRKSGYWSSKSQTARDVISTSL